MIDDELREMVLNRKSAGDVQTFARARGMKLMRDDGRAKVLQGITTIEEIGRVTKVDAAALAG